MSARSAEDPLSGQPVGGDPVRSNGLDKGERSSRARWKVPLAIILGVLASVVLAAVNGLQLASLERALGGLRTPEAQLAGYDAGYIELVRLRMTDELLERYGASHYLWDMLFPVVFAGTVILLIARICAGRKRRWLLMVAPVLFAGVDIAENLTLEAVMTAPTIVVSTVTLASTLTIAKGVLLALSIMSALLALLTRPKPRRS